MRLLWDGICMGADLSYRAPLFYYKRRRCTDRLYWMCQYEAELRTYCMCNFSWVFILSVTKERRRRFCLQLPALFYLHLFSLVCCSHLGGDIIFVCIGRSCLCFNLQEALLVSFSFTVLSF